MSIDWSQLIPWLIAIPVGVVACALVALIADRDDHRDGWPVHDPHDRDREDAA